MPDHLYPKLVSQEGARPRIKDEPPLIFHPTAELAPGMESGYAEAIAAYRETLPEHIRVAVRPVPLLRPGDQGRRRRQRRHDVRRRAVHGGRRRPAVPAGEGGAGLGARALCGQEPASESRPARRGGPAPDADRERRVPRLDPREERPRLLRPPASRHEDVRDHRGLGHGAVAAVRRACARMRWPAHMPARATPR